MSGCEVETKPKTKPSPPRYRKPRSDRKYTTEEERVERKNELWRKWYATHKAEISESNKKKRAMAKEAMLIVYGTTKV